MLPRSVRISMPFSKSSPKFSLRRSTEGQTETQTLMPMECSSSTMALGSGQ